VEQKRLAKAVALADDVPELIAELRQRAARIQHIEAQILSARRAPSDLDALVTQVEASLRTKLADLRTALSNQADRRGAFLALFPSGLTFAPTRTPDGARQVWKLRGDVDLGLLVGSDRVRTRPPSDVEDHDNRTARNSSILDGGSNRMATRTVRYAFRTTPRQICLAVSVVSKRAGAEGSRRSAWFAPIENDSRILPGHANSAAP
jgi:hypothetical protein